jgi:hypothetical protein
VKKSHLEEQMNNVLKFEIGGYTVIRDMSKSMPWEIWNEKKKVQAFRSYRQLMMFIFP